MELGLREKNHGSWEGKLRTEISPPEGHSFPQSAFDGSIESDGESTELFRTRVSSTFHRIGERHHGQHILVSSHAGVLWTLGAIIAENPFSDPQWWPANTTIIEVSYSADGTFTILA